MTKTQITIEDFTKAMEDAVALKGEDFVYLKEEWAACVYEEAGKPSCLLGHALYNLGLPFPERNINIQAVLVANYDVPRNLRLAAAEAQRDQDRGETWGNALSSFRHILDHPDDWYGAPTEDEESLEQGEGWDV